MTMDATQKEIHKFYKHRFDPPKYEIADIFTRYLPAYLKKHKLSTLQYKVVNAIMSCRTAKLGYHKYKCEECGYEKIEYNSCRNRHCPKCQGAKRIEWVHKRLEELLPVYYYHAVFTMVHSLNIIALYNKEIFYDIMMRASAKTLQVFAADPKYLGAKIGFVGILHTWGQALTQHIHVHFIIPGGGISSDGKRWINLPYRKKFLFPVKAMSMRMRSTFQKMLQQAYDEGKLVFPDELRDMREPEKFKKYLNKSAWENWINYTKKPFGSAEEVMKYIGRYTHRVAISNQRILDIRDDKVTFKYKEYKDGNVTPKIMTLKAEEFIRRFMLHILPRGFQKIRYFGIFSNGLKSKYLKLARDLLNVIEEKIEEVKVNCKNMINNLLRCPSCGTGLLHIIEIFKPDRLVYG
jgi:predicted Zn-ribbon and HTH transcriptional regulator